MGNMVPTLDDKGKKTGEQWCNGSFQTYRYYRQMGKISAQISRNTYYKSF